jgi:hypothetical protein
MSCAHCPQTEEKLDPQTIFYYGFGGYHVEKDGKLFYRGNVESENPDDWKTLAEIELLAKESPDAHWKVILNNPLRGATWERALNGDWILTETNNGFA